MTCVLCLLHVAKSSESVCNIRSVIKLAKYVLDAAFERTIAMIDVKEHWMEVFE